MLGAHFTGDEDEAHTASVMKTLTRDEWQFYDEGHSADGWVEVDEDGIVRVGAEVKPGDIADVVAALAQRLGGRAAGILYGGSVALPNAVELLFVPHVTGLFIGRAAWDVDGYVAILDAVAAAQARA